MSVLFSCRKGKLYAQIQQACTQLFGTLTHLFILHGNTSTKSAPVIDDSVHAFQSAGLLPVFLRERRADFFIPSAAGSINGSSS